MIYHALQTLLEELEDGCIPEDRSNDPAPAPLSHGELICMTRDEARDETQKRAELLMRHAMGSYAASSLNLIRQPEAGKPFHQYLRRMLLTWTKLMSVDPALAVPMCKAVLDTIDELLAEKMAAAAGRRHRAPENTATTARQRRSSQGQP